MTEQSLVPSGVWNEYLVEFVAVLHGQLTEVRHAGVDDPDGGIGQIHDDSLEVALLVWGRVGGEVVMDLRGSSPHYHNVVEGVAVDASYAWLYYPQGHSVKVVDVESVLAGSDVAVRFEDLCRRYNAFVWGGGRGEQRGRPHYAQGMNGSLVGR